LHQLFARPQAALTNDLTRALDRTNALIYEKEKEAKVSKEQREQIGVDLYGMQQQLAKQQLFLEKTHEKLTTLQQLRVESESFLQVCRHYSASGSPVLCFI
jgi:hypothetical protein